MKIPQKTVPLSCLATAALLSAAIAAFPPSGFCRTPSGLLVQGWVSATARLLSWPAAAAALAAGFALWRFAERRLAGGRLAALSPLAWLPALALLPHALALRAPVLAGLVLPLGGAFLAAVCAARALAPALDAPPAPLRRPNAAAWAWFAAAFVLLLAFRQFVARPRHFGSGDVQHYRIQAENLVERGNLDLTERVEAMMEASGVPADPASRDAWLARAHMKVNAAGRIHSYHSPGFPLLAWPFRKAFGLFGDGVLMALLGALALCGVRAACLAHGAPPPAADAVSLLLAFSFLWVYTVVSFLPEMLGFALVAWAFWAVAAQNRPAFRWTAAAVAAAACAALPVAHIRFAPTAGMLAAAFGVEGLFLRGEPFWRRKLPRLAAFSLACFAAWAALAASHAAMFRGTAAYDYSNIAGRVPLAMWAMFADRRGIVPVAPAVPAFLAAAAAALFRRDAAARRAAMALAVAAATLWFCCCTPAALGGACLNGRYFYPVVPALLPFFAIALARASRPGRLWMLFLALVPVLYLFFVAPFLSGAALVRAPAPARGFIPLALFWEPFPSFFGPAPSPRHALLAGSLFAAALFALSALACTRRGPRPLRAAAAAALLAAAFFCGRAASLADPPKVMGPFDVLMADRHFRDFRLRGTPPADFFSAFRTPCGDPRSVYVLTDDPDRPHDDAFRLQHPADLAVDDWRGRPLRWGKTHSGFASFRKAPGVVAARATGRVVRGAARLALQIGGVPDAPDVRLPEGPFDVVFVTPVHAGSDGGNFRLALENDVGEAVVDSTEYLPCPDGLPALLGGFPASSTLVPPP